MKLIDKLQTGASNAAGAWRENKKRNNTILVVVALIVFVIVATQ